MAMTEADPLTGVRNHRDTEAQRKTRKQKAVKEQQRHDTLTLLRSILSSVPLCLCGEKDR